LERVASTMPAKNGPCYLKLLLATLALLAGLYCVPSFLSKQRSKAIPLQTIDAWPYDLAWSREGKTLALAKEAGLELWDVTRETMQPLINRPQGVGPAGDLAYSKSGQYVAVGYGGVITVWKTSEWKKIAHFTYNGSLRLMTFADGDATLVVVLSADAAEKSGSFDMGHTMVCRWDASSGRPLSTVDFGSEGIFKVLSPSGRHGVIMFGKEGTGVYDLTTHRNILTNQSKVNIGNSIFSEDGSTLITYRNRRISILEAPSGVEIKHFDVFGGYNEGNDALLSISADGRLLATGGGFPNSHLASLISLESGRILDTVKCGPDESICKSIRLSPDGRSLATLTEAVNAKDQPVMPVLRLWKLPASW
jgi:WD40 repeat protein